MSRNSRTTDSRTITFMLVGALIGLLTGIGVAILTGGNALLGVGPAVGLSIGLSLAMADEKPSDDGDSE